MVNEVKTTATEDSRNLSQVSNSSLIDLVPRVDPQR